MKKKILEILFMEFFIFCLTGCVSNNQRDYTDEEIKDNSLQEILTDGHDFICEDMKNNDFYLTSNYIYINNSIYDQGKLYSNDQNCKKIDNINYDRYVILNSSSFGNIFIKDNQAYIFASYENNEKKLVEYDYMPEYKEIALENDVISISDESYILNDSDNAISYKFYVLKSDGNVYLYETKNHEIIAKDEIIYNSEEYGKIKYFYYTSNNSKSIENIILLSDNGLYTNETVYDDNCTKYADIECVREFKLNTEYEKVKNNIIFFNKDYIIDNEYRVYSNNFVKLEYIP